MKNTTLLVVDIGNSTIVFGIFKGRSLLSEWRVKTKRWSTIQLWRHIELLAEEAGVPPTMISGCVIASVVPPLTTRIHRTIAKRLQFDPIIIDGTEGIGMRNNYRTPTTLGADRICHALAAKESYGAPVIVIDFGTATTIDVIAENGSFLGGAIAPGVETSMQALDRGTARLSAVELTFPRSVIGSATTECIQSGVLYGTVGAVEGIVRRIQKILGTRTVVVATGGFARLIASQSKVIDVVDPALVLNGARIYFERRGKIHPRRKPRNKVKK